MNIYPNHSAIDTDLLQCLGIPATATVALNLTVPELTQLALDGGEGVLTEAGVLMCDTGKFTGRSPKDKFIVRDALTEDTVWWGPVNQPIEPEQFDHLHRRMLASLEGRSVFVRYVKAGADPRYAINIAVINEYAWHNLFCHNLFIETSEAERADFKPDWTILNLPGFQADPATDGTRQGNFTIINFSKRVILIGGTGYAGEMKKGIFSVLNLTLPRKGVLSMHCSANVGKAGDTALFFGLSGTGKTTLSTDPERELIGDDEHGWSDQVFNFEGGVMPKWSISVRNMNLKYMVRYGPAPCWRTRALSPTPGLLTMPISRLRKIPGLPTRCITLPIAPTRPWVPYRATYSS